MNECRRLTRHHIVRVEVGDGQVVDRGEGPAAVRLQWLHPKLRVSVWDPSPDLPTRCGSGVAGPSAPPDADNGRGLLLLDVFADRWGGCSTSEGPWGPSGKTIWFELTLGGRPDLPALAA